MLFYPIFRAIVFLLIAFSVLFLIAICVLFAFSFSICFILSILALGFKKLINNRRFLKFGLKNQCI